MTAAGPTLQFHSKRAAGSLRGCYTTPLLHWRQRRRHYWDFSNSDEEDAYAGRNEHYSDDELEGAEDLPPDYLLLPLLHALASSSGELPCETSVLCCLTAGGASSMTLLEHADATQEAWQLEN